MKKRFIYIYRDNYDTVALNDQIISDFQYVIWQYYRNHKRNFPWRETDNAYYILVSEYMLQQTQVSRVQGKYDSFIKRFPSFNVLAEAQLRDILKEWQGLGYNRRALSLHNTAKLVVLNYDGILPDEPEQLIKLPGIGQYTAAAVAAIAYNKPVVFIETNIRAVYRYFFFHNSYVINDSALLPFVERTLYRRNPREWYYALFDYGSMLKKKSKERLSENTNSKEKFMGSNRQIRGSIIRLLTTTSKISEADLVNALGFDKQRIDSALKELHDEKFIDNSNGYIHIAENKVSIQR